MIEINRLTKQYRMGEEVVTALNAVSLKIEAGKFISLVGPSGSGKTTLLNIICGLEMPTHGEVRVNGQNIVTLKDSSLSRFRANHVGYVFQTFNLLPRVTVLKNVMIPGILVGMSRSERQTAALNALKAVDLEKKANYLPNKLSGGERQRVAIARALINNPDIIFADEPTGNLDEKNAEKIMALLISVTKKQGKTLLLVTHNPELAQQADQIVRLKNGAIEKTQSKSAASQKGAA